MLFLFSSKNKIYIYWYMLNSSIASVGSPPTATFLLVTSYLQYVPDFKFCFVFWFFWILLKMFLKKNYFLFEICRTGCLTLSCHGTRDFMSVGHIFKIIYDNSLKYFPKIFELDLIETKIFYYNCNLTIILAIINPKLAVIR